MTTQVVLNPTAGSAADNQQLIERLRHLDEVDLAITEGAGDARRLAARAGRQGYAHVVAAGGDGTVNEVVNGLSDWLSEVTVGVIPLGTGNDIARSLGLPDDPELALKYVLAADDTRPIDLMRVANPEGVRLAVNHLNAGYSNLITDHVTSQMKQRWGPFAYLKTAATQLRDREEYHTRIRWNDGQVEVVDAINVFVANGRTVAGGLRVAPQASLEDGVLEVIVLRAGSLVELAGLAARLLVGALRDSDQVIARSATSLHIESTPPMTFSVDGEPFCEHLVDVRVVPGALRAIVGPNYIAEPALVDEVEDDDGRPDEHPPHAE